MEQGADSGASLMAVGVVTAVPALAMAGGSCAISAGEPSEQMQARLQHFSAGLLIGAVVADIFPILRQHLYADDGQEVHVLNLVSAVMGVAAALGLMYGLKALELEGGDEEDEDSHTGGPAASSSTAKSTLESPLLGRAGSDKPEDLGLKRTIATLAARTMALEQLVLDNPVDREAVDEEVHGIDFLVDSVSRRCRGSGGIDVRHAPRLRHHAAALAEGVAKIRSMEHLDLPAIDEQLGGIALTLRYIHSHAEHHHGKAPFRRWSSNVHSPRQFPGDEGSLWDIPVDASAPVVGMPWGLVLAVVIDSMVDGMLIGLAGSVALQSGWMMALATAIEMGFLGYSFACAIVKTSARRHLMVTLLGLPPVAMMSASILAAGGVDRLQRGPGFVGLIAFALVALLFLVVEELLLEAREKAADVWHISIWLYIGLLLTFSLDVILG